MDDRLALGVGLRRGSGPPVSGRDVGCAVTVVGSSASGRARLRPLAGLTRDVLGRELLAGVTLLAIAVPLNIGYAQIAGLPATAGLYALVLPTVVYALIVSSRQLVASPDAAAAALVASSIGGLAVAGSATYATMVALLPAIATVVGIVVLAQIPTWVEIAGVALVVGGVALHRPANQSELRQSAASIADSELKP